MTQAIITKYLGPSATKSARVKASCEAGSITIPWDSFYTRDQNHIEAVQALCVKLNWREVWHYGWLGDRMVAVRGD